MFLVALVSFSMGMMINSISSSLGVVKSIPETVEAKNGADAENGGNFSAAQNKLSTYLDENDNIGNGVGGNFLSSVQKGLDQNILEKANGADDNGEQGVFISFKGSSSGAITVDKTKEKNGGETTEKSTSDERYSISSQDHKSKKKNQITRISLLGERNSGTNWMYGELNKCFNDTSLKVKRTLTRYKHWFQDEKVANNKNQTIVIALVRDPYYWVDAMRRKPHHATVHIHLTWKDFVTKPWTMERVGHDLEIKGINVTNIAPADIKPDFLCQEKFQYHQVNSCIKNPFPEGYFGRKRHWSEQQPTYEMHYDTGEPYNNILELRADKIINLLSTAEYRFVQDYLLVNYEELVRKGTDYVIRHIEEKTGVKALCEPYPARKNHAPRSLDPKFVKWISDHMDWDVENLIGYKKLEKDVKSK